MGESPDPILGRTIAGQALVTVEREHVLRSFVTTLTGNAPVVEVPLEDGDAPNVFVSVMMLIIDSVSICKLATVAEELDAPLVPPGPVAGFRASAAGSSNCWR